jgi:hypothetical protein
LTRTNTRTVTPKRIIRVCRSLLKIYFPKILPPFIRRGVEYPRTRSPVRGGALGRLNSYPNDGGVKTSPVQNEKSPQDFFFSTEDTPLLAAGFFIPAPYSAEAGIVKVKM